MYITVIAILITIIYFYGIGFINTIINSNIKPGLLEIKTQFSSIGLYWFISILIVNLLILIFIVGYYYIKKNYSLGPTGPRGFEGEKGFDASDCKICNT